MARRTLVLDQPVEATEVTKKKSRKGIYIGVAILALVPVVGSTFALNIGINGGSAIEFGQGYNVVAACDNAITLTPSADFSGSTNSAQWFLSSIELTNFDGTACDGKTLKIIPRDNNGGLISDTDIYEVAISGNSTNCVNTDVCTASLDGTTLTVNVLSAPITDNISMFTTESS